MLDAYLTTLLRIPRDIRLSMATREFAMDFGHSCICGWAVREALARAVGRPAEDVELRYQVAIPGADFSACWMDSIPGQCVQLFGGDHDEWRDLFEDVTYDERLPEIELAFVLALEDACSS